MASKVYVDLDSLLDTRLGTIAKIDPNLSLEALQKKEYYTRESEDYEWLGIDKEDFQREWSKRDKETLSLSPATLMCKEIGKIVIDLVTESKLRTDVGEVEVVVNVYPYNLTEEERQTIANCITYYTGSTVHVDTVSLMPSLLIPSYFKDEFAVCVMYQYGEWMEVQAEAFAKTQISETTVLAPRLYERGLPSQEEMEDFMFDDEAFQAIELLSKGLVNLELIDVRYWCAMNSNNTTTTPESLRP